MVHHLLEREETFVNFPSQDQQYVIPQSILTLSKFVPKFDDFGLAILKQDAENQDEAKVSLKCLSMFLTYICNLVGVEQNQSC